MSTVDVTLDVVDLERVVDSVGWRVKDIPMSLLGEGMITAIDELIQSEGDGKWTPFAASTLLRHPRRAGGLLLQNTGLLANLQMETGPDWVEVESPAPYSYWHTVGTKRTKMPARDFLAVDMGAVLEELADLVADEVSR